MATFFFKRLARATPIAVTDAFFGGKTKSSFSGFRIPIGAIAALSGGISYYYCFDSSNLVISHLGFLLIGLW